MWIPPLRTRIIVSFFICLVLGMAIMGVVMTFALSMAIGIIGGFVFFLLAGLVLRQWVLQPIDGLRRTVEDVGDGHAPRPVVESGDDDLAALAQAITRLSTASQQRIEALEAEQAKISAIVDNMVVGIIALDAQGCIHFINPSARHIFDIGAEEVVGQPLLDIVRHHGLADFVDQARSHEQGGVCHGEIEVRLSTPRVLDVNSVSIPLGTLTTGVLLIFHDMTELRRLEQARVEFVANVSHELRTPLTAIKGYLETLLDEMPTKESRNRRFLEVVNTHTERLGRLVDDLLQLSNIETGRVVLHPESIALAKFMTEVASMFEGKCAQQGIVLENAIPPNLQVYADRDRLTQIFVNLINNALQYTPKGGQVTLVAQVEDGGFVAIQVRDTGQGVPASALPRLTERFYRVDKARSREQGGTGLGLAIVKHLVHLHGGRLHIESEVNKGMMVQVALPGQSGS